MVFSSPTFLFLFLPITIGLYYIVHPKLKNLCLLGASVFFYSWGEPKYIFLMLLSILVNYVFGLIIHYYEKNRSIAKIYFCADILYNVWMLVYFKYLDFLITSWNSAGAVFGRGGLPLKEIALPIGISFFTFQIMSYVIDLYWGKVKVQRNPLNLALYISLFPQLIAGPIVRYIDVENQMQNRSESLEKFSQGAIRFMIGFAKKIMLANTVSRLADTAFSTAPDSLSMSMAWLGIICYTLQIYFDFSAYSDMAIGLGKMFGFDFLENFNYPYISKSIQEFWRRWHISLSSWFRDYVYFPLGGSHVPSWKIYRNLLIVFLITGIWHGASWNFVVWGLFHGAFLMLERGKWGHILKKFPPAAGHLYVLFVMTIGWVFFRANTLTEALRYIKNMFRFSYIGIGNTMASLNGESLFFIAAGIVFSMPVIQWAKNLLQKNQKGFILESAVTYTISVAGTFLLFAVAISYMAASNGYNPFIYFRF